MKQKDEGTQDDRGRDGGGTNFILRIKEQETRLTLQEYDDDDYDEVNLQFPHTAFCNLVRLDHNIMKVNYYHLNEISLQDLCRLCHYDFVKSKIYNKH